MSVDSGENQVFYMTGTKRKNALFTEAAQTNDAKGLMNLLLH